MPPDFYYDQEDLLRERQRGKAWAFTALRPETVCGFAVGNPMNLLMVIAVHPAISKELGIPLRFPGTQAAYRALYQGDLGEHPGRSRRLGRHGAASPQPYLQPRGSASVSVLGKALDAQAAGVAQLSLRCSSPARDVRLAEHSVQRLRLTRADRYL